MNNSQIIATHENETLSLEPTGTLRLRIDSEITYPTAETALLWLQFRALDTDENIAQIIEIN